MHPRSLSRRLRLILLRHRRLLAALLTAVAALAGFRAVTAPAEPAVPVLVAAHDLPAGAALQPGDLKEAGFAAETVPDGTVDRAAATGGTLAAPMRAGEPLTDARLVRPSLLTGYPGRVAVPVRLGDASTAALLRTGDRVDLVASAPDTTTARTVASSAPVIALPKPVTDRFADPGTAGALVLVAVTRSEMPAVVYASAASFVSVVIRD
ncbi:MAG: SAF domain-containing protein [Nocardioidaceae bacterium]